MAEQQNDPYFPRCFDSAQQWQEFKTLWWMSNGKRSPPRLCHDCTPEWRDKMIADGRCAHPETVFVMLDGEVVGVNGNRWFSWIGAITGKSGQVVGPPDRFVRDNFIIAKRAEAKESGKYLLTPESRAKQNR